MAMAFVTCPGPGLAPIGANSSFTWRTTWADSSCGAQGEWKYLPCLALPTLPTYLANVAADVKVALLEVYEVEMDSTSLISLPTRLGCPRRPVLRLSCL